VGIQTLNNFVVKIPATELLNVNEISKCVAGDVRRRIFSGIPTVLASAFLASGKLGYSKEL